MLLHIINHQLIPSPLRQVNHMRHAHYYFILKYFGEWNNVCSSKICEL